MIMGRGYFNRGEEESVSMVVGREGGRAPLVVGAAQ